MNTDKKAKGKGPGRPRRLRVIIVRSVSTDLHPEFRKDRDHRFIRMPEADRLAEVIEEFAIALAARGMDESKKIERGRSDTA